MIDDRRVRCCIRPCRRSRPRRGSGAEVWICAKHWRAVDRGLRDEQWRLRMEFHRLRRSTRKCRYSPVALRRALIALWCDHAAAFNACIQDARIKAALGVT